MNSLELLFYYVDRTTEYSSVGARLPESNAVGALRERRMRISFDDKEKKRGCKLAARFEGDVDGELEGEDAGECEDGGR